MLLNLNCATRQHDGHGYIALSNINQELSVIPSLILHVHPLVDNSRIPDGIKVANADSISLLPIATTEAL